MHRRAGRDIGLGPHRTLDPWLILAAGYLRRCSASTLAPAVAQPYHLGAMVPVDASPLFIGRAAEMGTLMAALKRAIGGEPSVVAVGGEAGVGKTRLIEEFEARRVQDAGPARAMLSGIRTRPAVRRVRRPPPGHRASGSAGTHRRDPRAGPCASSGSWRRRTRWIAGSRRIRRTHRSALRLARSSL